MDAKIAILVEDTCTGRGFLGEHGFSVWLETGEGSVLFDTGAGNALTHNASKMGIGLGSAKNVVLSHGHDDHTGGLEAYLKLTGGADVIACPGAFDRKYRIAGEKPPQYIGAPLGEEDYRDLGARFTYIKEPTRLFQGVWLTGPVPRTTGFEGQEPTLFVKSADDQFVPDPVPDDQSMIVVTPSGLVVILGCAHAGIINTLKYASEFTGIDQVHTVIGGPHLLRAGDATVDKVAEALKGFGVQRLGLCHCLGARQSHLMFQRFGSALVQCETGTRFTLQ